MPDPTVLILGCGAGGIVAARELRRLLPATHRVIVIDKEPRAPHLPSLLAVVTGEKRPEAVNRQRSQIARKGIEFVHAEVRKIDLENRYVRADSREFHYDLLVIALGAEASFEGYPGLADAYSFHSLDAAERLAASLRYFQGGRVAIAVAGPGDEYPPAPYEAAMLLEHFFHARRMRQKVDIHVYTPEQAVFAMAGHETSEGLTGLLAHKGIELHMGHTLRSADSAKHTMSFTNGETAWYQMLITVPHRKTPAVLRDTGLLNEAQWLHVDPSTMETSRREVFAVGDIVQVSLGDGVHLPKALPLVESQAKAAAANIAYRLRVTSSAAGFRGNARLFIEAGGRTAASVEGDFLARRRKLTFKHPSALLHWSKAASDRYWLWRWY